jgi:hypothetical protein
VTEGKPNYHHYIVRRGDCSDDGLREKAAIVLAEMERRIGALELRWQDPTTVQVYTVHDLYPLLADEIVARGAASRGLTWHYARAPVVDLEFEMDRRGVQIERVF